MGSTPELSAFASRCVFLEFPDRVSSQEEERFKEICLSRDKEDSEAEERHVACVTSYQIVLKPSRKLFSIQKEQETGARFSLWWRHYTNACQLQREARIRALKMKK